MWYRHTDRRDRRGVRYLVRDTDIFPDSRTCIRVATWHSGGTQWYTAHHSLVAPTYAIVSALSKQHNGYTRELTSIFVGYPIFYFFCYIVHRSVWCMRTIRRICMRARYSTPSPSFTITHGAQNSYNVHGCHPTWRCWETHFYKNVGCMFWGKSWVTRPKVGVDSTLAQVGVPNFGWTSSRPSFGSHSNFSKICISCELQKWCVRR